MFCMKILGVVSDEVLKVFHSCFAVANQRLEFVLKFRNLKYFLQDLIEIVK